LQFKFSAHEILRKYIRYALNEKPFDPEMVSNLLLLRRSSGLSDKEIVGVLNDISTMVVKARGKGRLAPSRPHDDSSAHAKYLFPQCKPWNYT
jgi:hypothetical protein